MTLACHCSFIFFLFLLSQVSMCVFLINRFVFVPPLFFKACNASDLNLKEEIHFCLWCYESNIFTSMQESSYATLLQWNYNKKKSLKSKHSTLLSFVLSAVSFKASKHIYPKPSLQKCWHQFSIIFWPKSFNKNDSTCFIIQTNCLSLER